MKETNENERNELEFGSFCVNIKEQDKVFQAYEKKKKEKGTMYFKSCQNSAE